MTVLQILWIIASGFLADIAFMLIVHITKARTNTATQIYVFLIGMLACYTYFNGGVV